MNVSLTSIKEILEDEFFVSKYIGKLKFLPDEFYDWASKCNLKVRSSNIERWEDFEYGKVDFEAVDFYKLIFSDKKYFIDTDVLFISDESLKKNIGFRFRLSEYDSFVSYYEEAFESDFFQPLDYIVYIRSYFDLKMIHHEGKLIQVSRGNGVMYQSSW